jgi:hypothetical protein
VRGAGLLPITAAKLSLGVSGVINAAFGFRAAFLAAFLGAAFFAVAMILKFKELIFIIKKPL